MVMTSQNKIPLRADFVKSLRMLPDLSNDQLKQIASLQVAVKGLQESTFVTVKLA